MRLSIWRILIILLYTFTFNGFTSLYSLGPFPPTSAVTEKDLNLFDQLDEECRLLYHTVFFKISKSDMTLPKNHTVRLF